MLHGKIYAIGGFDGATGMLFLRCNNTLKRYDLTFNDTLSIGLSSAERYDPKTDTWTMIESMSTRRSSVGVGVLCNQIYAVGGYDGSCRQCLNSYVKLGLFHSRLTLICIFIKSKQIFAICIVSSLQR